MPKVKRWPVGSTLHVRFIGGTETQRALVREQAAWWTAHANLTFAFDDAPDAQIRVTFDQRRSVVVRRHRQRRHPAQRGDDEPRVHGRRDGGPEFGSHRARARAPNPQASMARATEGARRAAETQYGGDVHNGLWTEATTGKELPPAGRRRCPSGEAEVADLRRLLLAKSSSAPGRRAGGRRGRLNAQERTTGSVADRGAPRLVQQAALSWTQKTAAEGRFGPDSTTDRSSIDAQRGPLRTRASSADLGVTGTYHLQVRHYRPTGNRHVHESGSAPPDGLPSGSGDRADQLDECRRSSSRSAGRTVTFARDVVERGADVLAAASPVRWCQASR